MYADLKEIALFDELGVDSYINKTTPSTIMVASLKKILLGEKVFIANNLNKADVEPDNFAGGHQFTKREVEILKLLKKSYTNEQIAAVLNLSVYTVETHRKNINNKLNFSSKKEFYDFLNEMEL
jgi:DNA-binding NarL/FixJ family response regulator